MVSDVKSDVLALLTNGMSDGKIGVDEAERTVFDAQILDKAQAMGTRCWNSKRLVNGKEVDYQICARCIVHTYCTVP